MNRQNLSTGGALATMAASAAGNQAGAALGAHAFPAIGPAGVVAVRQFVAAAVLLPVARPNLRRFTWAQWWPTLLLGLVFATMNLSLYTAVDRIGLGLAVTLEFLGPLAVALAGSRTSADLGLALVAGAGVYVLVLPGPSSDFFGVGMGLLAAVCWAAYILLNRLVGKRLPGLQAPAAATAVSAAMYVPVAVIMAMHGRFGLAAVGWAIGAGVLCSVVPYAADLVALRRIPTRFFGLLQSVHPVFAALAGAAILGQVPAAHVWAGIAIVVGTNVVAVAARLARPAAQDGDALAGQVVEGDGPSGHGEHQGDHRPGRLRPVAVAPGGVGGA
ncbi:EamA family transporter [Dactylosporangium sp. CA-139066]|uniref:EamA family transporter n=1 Tax=Dactylosporangium sp. CA-139066 TaxID=3239930 RepID=UPI003D90A858